MGLVDYSLWGCRELETTEQLSTSDTTNNTNRKINKLYIRHAYISLERTHNNPYLKKIQRKNNAIGHAEII